jgi:hypothetical protein
LKYKPHVAALAAGVGLMAFASPAMALPGDDAIKSSSPFRLNPYTLEPGCTTRAHTDSHIDIAALVDGDIREELHVTVGHDSPVSVDQVLVPGRYGGYAVYDEFDTGSIDNDADVDPNQTAVDLFGPEGTSFIDNDDVIVCVSDHDAYQNEPYEQEAGGLVAAWNRPEIEPKITCLGASAIEPLNTYKVGFGYGVKRGYDATRPVQLLGVRDPNAVDFNHDGTPDAVYIKTREDGAYDARRVNDMDAFGEEFGYSSIADLGQTELFKLSGDETAWTLSNNNEPDTLSNLITFTTQGDLPLTWTVRASLAPSRYEHSITLDDAALRRWEADWQVYYDGGAKPSMRLCPGTNSPAPDTDVVVNVPQQTGTVPGSTQTITREITTVQTVAGATTVKKVSAAKAKAAKRASCMKKAKAKKSKKARKNAMKKCRRI